MDFIIKDIKENINWLAREIGYIILEAKSPNEYNMVRKLTGDNYPRFHIYVKPFGRAQGTANNYLFNLHLDQKQPSYAGTHAHAGEYEGPVVQDEADRIIELFKK